MPSMPEASTITVRTPRIILPALAGAAISWAAMLTYFLVVPFHWPDLRDAGHPNVVLAAAGVSLCVLALVRATAGRRRRVAAWILLVLGFLPAALLAGYIYYFSWRLPGEEGVVRVGEAAPAFRLKDQEGKERTLEEFRGKPLLLVFFRGHW